VELAIYLYPKGEVPKYRTRLSLFGASPGNPGRFDIPPNSVVANQTYQVLRQAARLENFQPHMHCEGRRWRWKLFCLTYDSDAELRRSFQFQLDE